MWSHSLVLECHVTVLLQSQSNSSPERWVALKHSLGEPQGAWFSLSRKQDLQSIVHLTSDQLCKKKGEKSLSYA